MNESPHDLGSRLQEAAHLTSFQQPQEIIEAMFIWPLQPEIRIHIKCMGCYMFSEMLTAA